MMRNADPDCDLCRGSGVHPDSFPGSTGGWNGPQPPEPEPCVCMDVSDIARQVKRFHRRFELPMRDRPGLLPGGQVLFRLNLIDEEVRELADAMRDDDLVGVADALADIVYVVYGTALEYGIPLDSVLSEVHRSNMTKSPPPVTGGKVVKGSDYRPPNVARALVGLEQWDQ